MKPQLVIGVDPGISGAIAFLRCQDRKLIVDKMPTKRRQTRGGTKRNEVDCESLGRRLRQFHDTGARVQAVVERVGARTYRTPSGIVRGQGAAASFEFGKSQGIILGALAALEIPFLLVDPGVWKSLLNLSTDKDQSRARASEIFPSNAASFRSKNSDGSAEAALLAWLGYKAYYHGHFNLEGKQ